mmetsp:Transcript_34169/g.71770  ORF Transcript_34169/g.71770 Transcript_34169/m.71770 type:complete len:316 (-) Transcript_34169:428-1375(-)
MTPRGGRSRRGGGRGGGGERGLLRVLGGGLGPVLLPLVLLQLAHGALQPLHNLLLALEHVRELRLLRHAPLARLHRALEEALREGGGLGRAADRGHVAVLRVGVDVVEHLRLLRLDAVRLMLQVDEPLHPVQHRGRRRLLRLLPLLLLRRRPVELRVVLLVLVRSPVVRRERARVVHRRLHHQRRHLDGRRRLPADEPLQRHRLDRGANGRDRGDDAAAPVVHGAVRGAVRLGVIAVAVRHLGHRRALLVVPVVAETGAGAGAVVVVGVWPVPPARVVQAGCAPAPRARTALDRLVVSTVQGGRTVRERAVQALG